MSVSVCVVGLGQFGPSFVQYFKDHPNVSRVALCDLRSDRLARRAKDFEIGETYGSLSEACEADLDALFVMTQPWLHAEHAVQAVSSGKHVYTAVPAAQSVDDCERLVEAVERTGMIYMNGETSYFRPETAFCRQKAAEGAFGRFVHAEAEYMHDIDHGLRAVNESRWGAAWGRDKTGGVPMHYPTHSTCFIVSVMGAHMTSVSALGYRHPGDDWYRKDTIYENDFSNETALFEMSNGASARVCEYRRIGYPGCERASGIYGTEGSYEQSGAGAVWAWKGGMEAVQPPRHHEELPEALAANLGGHGGSHAYLAHEFVDSVNRERLPRINVWEAVRYAVPGVMAHESALRGGERLRVPDFGDPPAGLS